MDTSEQKNAKEQTSDDDNIMQILGEIYYITIRTENENHYAKRNALAQSSTYFRRIFTSRGFIESGKDIIEIPSITSQNLENIIEFADTGKISLTEDNAIPLLLDANYLGIDDLKHKCYEFMCKNVTTNNAFQAYQIADLLDYTLLKNNARKVICSSAFLIVCERDEYFLDCDVNLLNELLSAPKVQACPSVTLFNAVMRWFTWNMDKRKTHLENILLKIKLADIDKGYFKNGFENFKHEIDVEKIISLPLLYVQTSLQSETRIAVLQASSLDTIEVYSSFTGKWELIETGDKECRSSFTCAAHDGKLYVFGGEIDGKCTNTAKVYDFSIKSWSSIAPMSTARARAASVVLGNYIYVFAGYTDEKNNLNSAERYYPTTNQWESIASLKERRCDHSAVAFKGHLYVNGGMHCFWGSERSCNWNSQIEKYDPRTNTWTNVEILKRRRRSSFGITVLNDSIYSCGGVEHGDMLDCLEYYNPNEKKQWGEYTKTLDFSMNQRRANHALFTCEGKLWAIGGSDNTVEICDPKSNFWIYGPSMNKISGAVVGAVFTIEFNEKRGSA